METLKITNEATEKELERLRTFPCKNEGEFDYRELEEADVRVLRPAYQLAYDRSRAPNPRPFCDQCRFLTGSTGTHVGRKWIMIRGNISGSFSFPFCYFKNHVQQEFYPIFGTIAIKDTFNKFAPGEFTVKFPNDVICRKHWRKCCGTLFKKFENYAVGCVGIDIADCPKDEELRQWGIKACCLKKHTDNIPSFEEFMCFTMRRVIELMNQYDTVEKIVEFINQEYGEFNKKSYKVIINNINADPAVDGITCCPGFPNALLKAYVNNVQYEVDETYYEPPIIPEETNDFSVSHDKMAELQHQIDLEIQAELEKKEREEKEKEKKEEK